MAKSKGTDPFAGARKYAGKNTAENVGSGKGSDMGVAVVRPFVMHPGGSTFDEAGWGRRKNDVTSGHLPPSGKKD